MPFTAQQLLNYMALPEEEQATLEADPTVGPSLQSFKMLPQQEQVKVLDGLGAPQPRSMLKQAMDVAGRVGSATMERWQEQGQNLFDVASSLIPTWESIGKNRPLPGTTLGEKVGHLLSAVNTLSGVGGALAPVGALGQAIGERLGLSPERAKTSGNYAEMLTALGLPLLPTGPSTSARALSQIGIGRPNVAAQAANAQEAMQRAFPSHGFPNSPLSETPKQQAILKSTSPLPSELQSVINGEAQAFLKPPATEGTVPTVGEQTIASMNLQQVAKQTGMGYFKSKEGAEVVFNPDLTTTSKLKKLDKAGKLAEIVNGPDTSPKPEAPTTAVVARTPEGTEIRTVLTDTPEKTAAAINAQPSGTQVEVKPAAEAVPQVIQDRMQALRNTIDDARTSIPTGKQIYRDQEGNIVKTGNAGSLFDKFKTLFPELEQLPPGVTPKQLVSAIDKDKGNKLYRLIQDEVKIQQAKEAANTAAVSTRPSDYEQFAKYADELAAQPEPVKTPIAGSRTPAVKQPWQLTQDEYVYGEHAFNSPKTYKKILKNEGPEAERFVSGLNARGFATVDTHNLGDKVMVQVVGNRELIASAKLNNVPGVAVRQGAGSGQYLTIAKSDVDKVLSRIPPLEKPTAVMWENEFQSFDEAAAAHKALVMDAIKRGEAVRPEVLAEYPDLAKSVKSSIATQPPLLTTQATMPPEGLQPKAPQVEHGDLLEGLKPQEPTRQAGLPLEPGDTTVEMGMGVPIPQKVKDAVKRLFPGGQGDWWGGLQEVLAAQREKLPSELRVIKEAPQSAAISSVEGARAIIANGAAELTKTPWAQAIRKYTPEQFKQLENHAVQIWDHGGKTNASLDQAIQAMPPEIQTMLRYRQSRLPIEKAARKILGLPKILETSGPYFPRLTNQGLEDIKAMSRGRANLVNDLQTTLRSFQQARFFRTMTEGEAQGMKYQDPRAAWAMREWHSLQLEATAQLMTNLEHKGVLFRTADAAKQASPIGKAFGIEGLPGATQWFAPTHAEREFVMQNLARANRGALGGLISLGNQLFRNPNLFNPLPHIIKNMGYKFGLSLGNPANILKAAQEYEQGTSPLVQRFKTIFPTSETAMAPGQTFDPFIRPDNIAAAGLRAIGKINQFSSSVIFEHADPALRFARWKQYVANGMSDQAAANHVQVDLIRYGTRSDAVDFWKSIPLNFFVPWRTGTVTSLVKQVTSHPIRAAAFIGAVDYLREVRYRQSGQWTHLPIDYVESPIAQAIQHHDPKTLAALAATTALFGPGGASTASTLRDALNDIRGGDEKGRIINMFWGLSQLYNIPKEFQRYQQTGDANHLINIFTSAAVAEHSALNYEPRRLATYLPESLPWMQKSSQVALAEAIQANRRARGEAIRARQAVRPRPTIEELLGVSP